ncbi:LysR family transcriptional regulator [Rhizobium deserti]|uniref:LysR family transcriptional regulator n=1 Tax=Rhizobium deserti TaxID=2547961 RepID=UPI0013876852|nr:LysR family transcriptional regulator [Rhizobium deserti]
MRIRQLEYFLEVCACGSITQASAKLNVAQPALGMQLRSLEQELGTKLLKRTARGTVATAAGQVCLEEARIILNRVRLLKQRLKEMEAAETSTVRLGLTPSMATLMTGRLLETIGAGAVPINVQIFEEFSHILMSRVERGELDIALAFSVPEGTRLSCEPLLQEELTLIMAPGTEFDVAKPIAFRDLVDIPVVMPSERDFLRQLINEALRREDLSLNILYQVESMRAMKDLILRGRACGILPYGNVVGEVSADHLRTRRIIDPPLTRTLYFIWPAGIDFGRKERIVVSALRELLPNLFEEVATFSPLPALDKATGRVP